MKKRLIPILIILSIVLSIFLLASCSVNYDGEKDNMGGGSGNLPENNYDTELEEAPAETAPNRKIIYSASVSFSIVDFDERINIIKGALKEGEWFDSESISNDNAYFVARVKSNRLDTFIDEATKDIESKTIRKDANDISLNYQSTEDRILALNEEKALLTQYLDDGTISASYALTRLTEINTQIKRLNGELASFDSLVEYSTVTINLYRRYSAEDPAYNQRAGKTLSAAWKALLSFFEFLGLAIVAILPWLIVIVPVGGGAVMIIRYKKRLKPFHNIPKKKKVANKNEDNTEEK